MVSDKSLKYIKKWLPKGWVQILHKSTGYSKSSISMVLSGDYFNAIIIEEAIQLSRQNKKEHEKKERNIRKQIDDQHL